MNIDYQERPPCGALNGVILAYWRVAGDGTSVPSPTILPDPYVEIVINLGGAVTLDGPPFTGSQPARAVVGCSRRRSRCDIRQMCARSAFGCIPPAPRRSWTI